MKIAIIGQKGIPAKSGGIEKHVEGLAECLVKAGHEVFVYTRPHYTDKNLREYMGVKLISLPSLFTKHLDAISHTFLSCIDVVFRTKPDVVHFHGIGPSSLIWLIKLFKPELPVVATFHCRDYFHLKWSLPARIFLKFGELMCCKMADRVIAVSRELKNYAQDKYGVQAAYIPNSIKIEKKTRLGVKEFGLKKGGYILAVSRLIKHKGIHYLINAYNNLDTDKKLVIVGEGSFTDNYVKELKKLARKNGNIIFMGIRSGESLKKLFSNAYCFVQTSESEGLSIAILEAMSFGLPVLVSDIPENKEAIDRAGFTFKSGDSIDLQNAINYILSNPKEAKSKGLQAKLRIKEEYNWENTINNICKLYKIYYPRQNGILLGKSGQLKFKI